MNYEYDCLVKLTLKRLVCCFLCRLILNQGTHY